MIYENKKRQGMGETLHALFSFACVLAYSNEEHAPLFRFPPV